jgi:hypothetical protein
METDDENTLSGWDAAQQGIARGANSDRGARLRGTFTAWFFYIHRRTGSWNAITAYIREGGDQGVIVSLRNRRGTYVQRSETTDRGYQGNYHPFLTRMGYPKCS